MFMFFGLSLNHRQREGRLTPRAVLHMKALAAASPITEEAPGAQ